MNSATVNWPWGNCDLASGRGGPVNAVDPFATHATISRMDSAQWLRVKAVGWMGKDPNSWMEVRTRRPGWRGANITGGRVKERSRGRAAVRHC